MNKSRSIVSTALAALTALAGWSASPLAFAQASTGGIDISQVPLFTQTAQPPLNMLVMGKDHKIYYEAYNDASDLDGDGILDVGYKPAQIDYFGYFNSNLCYTWSPGNNRFEPAASTQNKRCSGQWSGDFLNYLTTSRMDALRRVLYGGWRQSDTTSDTTLQGAFFPQDGHSWGKEYQSVARDGYNIADYAPLTEPPAGRYHLFAVTTVTGNANTYPNYQAPMLRVLKNTDKRIWNWVSIEGPVAGNYCFTSSNTRVECVSNSTGGTWQVVPSSMLSGVTITTWKRTQTSPTSLSAMNTMFSTYGTTANRCGTGTVSIVNATGANNNPFTGSANNSCTHDNYFTLIEGTITVPAAGTYRFGIDGDDAIDLRINTTDLVGWYSPHGGDRSDAGLMSHSNTIYLTAGAHSFRLRHKEDGGDDNWGLFIYNPPIAVSRDDYYVRVQSCPSSNANYREGTCKVYPNGQYKPTGILHDYGENARMYFGLITGTQFNNLEGGVLRRNITNFGDEINASTGQFLTSVDGIANTISKLRMIGGGYGNSVTNNLNSDENWNWGSGTGNCPSVGDRAIVNGECRMWGNPLAEMLYESMRYYAGATAPTARFNSGGASQGVTEEATMGLPVASTVTWKNPYGAAPSGSGFSSCARPYQTIISDINPSYDGDLPGSAFNNVAAPTGTPSNITGFNAATEGQAIWNSEFGAGGRSVFIGEVGSTSDGAPTAKTASSFGNIRGLSPEEPTKGGTYYSASVARYARNNDINAAEGNQNLSTYAIALASPLPKITFPVGNGTITLLPFAKTASGTFGTGARKPTNTIVDFYVESIANFPGQPTNSLINGGRAYAVFRINYEDVEQGNDHDMDAIVRYLVSQNADGTVTVTLNSEYAAGSADQNMGYVISGTTRDGVYLDVRDTDSPASSFLPYVFNTPNPLLPGGCNPITLNALCNQQLPLNSTRVFTPSATASAAIQLENPLWFAAKYGAPTATASNTNGGPLDNYFLVTNPANLRTQLDRAFTSIIQTSLPSSSVATSSPRFVSGATLAYEVSYNSVDWTGDLRAYRLSAEGSYAGTAPIWSASSRMPAHASRSVFSARRTGASENGTTFSGTVFTDANLTAGQRTQIATGLTSAVGTAVDANLINYLRGDATREQGGTGCTTATCPYRHRSSRIGDIINSTPAVAAVDTQGYSLLPASVAGAAAVGSYEAYVAGKKTIYGNNGQNPVIYVGANDGMLHAFDGRDGSAGGVELFSYVPYTSLRNIALLANPSYNHRYLVDGTPTVGDAYWGGGWKTVLASSVGAGGRGVFALDVTNPRSFTASNVLWEFNDTADSSMGQFVGRPSIGITQGGTWVAVFGNGYNSANHRAVLHVRNLQTGAEVAKIDTGVGCSSLVSTCTTGPNGMATAALVDNTGDGVGDTIYAGDYLGNLWRFDQASNGTWSLGNGGQPIFVATDGTDAAAKRQSITSGIYTVAHPLGGTMVIFGTGRYLNADDADDERLGLGSRARVETIYGIWDAKRIWNPDTSSWTTSVVNSASATINLEALMAINGRADLQPQAFTSYTPLADNGTGGYRTATRNPVEYRTPDSPGTAASPRHMGWYLDLRFMSGLGSSARNLLAGERVTASPVGVLNDVVINTFRPTGNSCRPGAQNATLVLDALTGGASFTPIVPIGGWPTGQQPPSGALAGTETGIVPPSGEPPIIIVRPPTPTVPCLPGTPDCSTTPPSTINSCSWRSPNAADRTPGKPVPCGRISWKQLR